MSTLIFQRNFVELEQARSRLTIAGIPPGSRFLPITNLKLRVRFQRKLVMDPASYACANPDSMSIERWKVLVSCTYTVPHQSVKPLNLQQVLPSHLNLLRNNI